MNRSNMSPCNTPAACPVRPALHLQPPTPARRASVCLMALTVSLAASALAEKRPAPLFEDIGLGHFPITTSSKLGQRYFNQGLALAYGFNHAESVRSFQAVIALDPNCAMGYWGIAFALGANINRPMPAEDVPKAWAAVQQALYQKAKVTERERAYIEALAKRYSKEPVSDRGPLDKVYAQAMREVAQRYPDDLDASTLFAEALLDTMPWDYYTAGHQPKPATQEALQALFQVLRRDPRHAGANHFLIHAVEAGPTPELGLPSADSLRALQLEAGHLTHMPSHIYVRVGQYHDASQVNEQAIKADRAYLNHCKAQGYYPGLYYPHNINFLCFTTALEGRSQDCLKASRQIVGYERDMRCGPTTLVEAPRYRHLVWLNLARFGRWDDLLQEALPDREYVFDQAFWYFARGLALLAQGKQDDAQDALTQLQAIATGPKAAVHDNPFFPGSKLLAIAHHLLAAKVAAHQGELAGMKDHLHQAVQLEDALPYMEPPYWNLPTRRTLGALLLQHKQPGEAEKAFRESLAKLPRNGWDLFGLEASLRAQNKTEAAEAVRAEFQRAWQHADIDLDLSWF